ncbi:hypothetical protein BH23GEM5_BH23GEM5_08020 [soil metagenome]
MPLAVRAPRLRPLRQRREAVEFLGMAGVIEMGAHGYDGFIQWFNAN